MLKLANRNRLIRTYLLTEAELETEGMSAKQADARMQNEDFTKANLTAKLTSELHTEDSISGEKVRVLPGIALVQGMILQAFSRRSYSSQRKR